MSMLNFGIIGTNFISDKFVDAVKKVDGAEVVAVYSRAYETGKSFSEKHCASYKIYCNLDDMLADTDVDAVYVASPTFLHKEHTVLALTAGKHVLCEKSVSVNYEQFLEMEAAASKTGKILLEAMRPAYDPALEKIISTLPLLGKIRRAHFEFCKYSSRYDNFKKGIVENAFNVELKNSALSDIGIYPLWLAVRLFGEPSGVNSVSVKLSNGFDGAGSIILDYREMFATVSYSKITESRAPSFIEGENATLIIDKISEPRELILSSNKGVKTIYTNPCDNNMVYEVAAFKKMTEGKLQSRTYLDTTAALMRTFDRVVDSQKNKTEY